MGNNLTNGDKQGLTIAALHNFLTDAERLGYPPDSLVRAEVTAFGHLLKNVSVREGDTRATAQAKQDAKNRAKEVRDDTVL
jgi:hypothetical protein